MGTGSPPEIWSNIMAELMVSDFPTSLAFWTGPIGFQTAFTRPAQKLACLTRPEGAQIMIYQRDGDWETGPLQPPYGRGAIIQIYPSRCWICASHGTIARRRWLTSRGCSSARWRVSIARRVSPAISGEPG